MNSYTGRLENWTWFGNIIIGRVYDDAKGRFEDGHQVMTSRVEEVIYEGGKQVAVTRNSTYLLGEELVPKSQQV